MKTIHFLLLLISFQSFSQLKIGDKAPDFKLWLTDGSIITQNETKGKIVVFKFWFTTCVPCITGIPQLNDLVEKYKNNDEIVFIAPAIDRSDIVRRFLTRYPFNFKVAYSANDVSQIYNTKGVFPSYFIIDKNGNIAYIDSQAKEIKHEVLEKTIATLLSNKKSFVLKR
jgi:peroxiredoxin